MKKTLKFYKWIKKHDVTYKWTSSEKTEVYCWIDFDLIKEFVGFFSIEIEDNLMVNLQDNCICVEMADLCDASGIDMNEVFD